MKTLILIFSFVSVVVAMFGGPKTIDLTTADDSTMQMVNQTANFAVDEINDQSEQGLLEFPITPLIPLELAKIVSAKSQVVEGTLYTLVIETYDADGGEDQYRVQVQYIPWMPDTMSLVDAQKIE
eukprot:TRINITY_DN7588_c2_g1_i1.p4 TRINITY_DN7588_c2_g1~~TRINITY_DN7588_c2_g1_i1.p4  ORF type:complete len:125 (+),score=17.24 TRINITY_DN7588_c2_g1_i1:159-533(+)